MNIQEAQEKLYELTEEFWKLNEAARALDDKADAVNEERRKLLDPFPILDIRNIGNRPHKKWTQDEIARWGNKETR